MSHNTNKFMWYLRVRLNGSFQCTNETAVPLAVCTQERRRRRNRLCRPTGIPFPFILRSEINVTKQFVNTLEAPNANCD